MIIEVDWRIKHVQKTKSKNNRPIYKYLQELFITDSEVFLECVIYPLYIDGDNGILSLLKAEIDFLISNSNPIEFFQGINFLCGEKMLKKVYGELPFYIFDENRINLLHSRLCYMKDKMESYKKGDFGKYKENMYDMASHIMRNFMSNESYV
jgi:hypothetical protein